MAVTIRQGKKYGGKGRTIEWLLFNDPGYFYWMVHKGIHRQNSWFSPCEQQEVARILRRADHLKIPGICTWCKEDRPITRMAMIRHPSGGLTDVGFDCDECSPLGSGWTFTRPAFRTPDIFRNYDKMGGKVLVKAIKYAYFKNTSYRMNAKRLEEFWDNEENFVNP